MLTENGYKALADYHGRTFKKEIVKIRDDVYYFVGYGHSNATLFIGDTSCVLVDTLDTDKRAQRLRQEIEKITDKPVKTIIFTHSHPDHTGGSGAFRDLSPAVVAHTPLTAVLGKTERINNILIKRAVRQFGYPLSEDELITQGLGLREGRRTGDGTYDILPVTEYVRETEKDIHCGGVLLKLFFAPGETDDQMYVYSPKHRLLCCGDNFYPCFPNLYALRGGAYRDVSNWVDSLSLILKISPDILLSGHGYAVFGKEIENTISLYREAIEYVLDSTLDCISKGMTCAETVRTVKLPNHLANLKFMGEHYGCVEWSVKSIYNGYIGWFDGNPTNIHDLTPCDEAQKTILLAGGREKVIENIKRAIDTKDYLWAMKLCDLLIVTEDDKNAKKLKADCCLLLRDMETSANGRHYYQMCAKELLSQC